VARTMRWLSSATVAPHNGKVSEIGPHHFKIGLYTGYHIQIGSMKLPWCQIWPDIAEIESRPISHNLEVKIILFGDLTVHLDEN
jgi:hypothetical protein